MKRICQILFVSLLVWHQSSAADINRIDGSTVETFEWSIKEIHESLSVEDAYTFNAGLWDMIENKYPLSYGTSGMKRVLVLQRALDAAHVTMNDVLVADVIEWGGFLASIKTEKADKIKPESNDERMVAEVICLNEKIEILSGDVRRNTRSDYFTYDIVFLIKNNMDFAISSISFDYALRQPDRSVAWAKENKYYSFKGGVEVGEERPVVFSIKESPYTRSDKTILSLEFTEARDSDGATVVVKYSNVKKSDETCRTSGE